MSFYGVSTRFCYHRRRDNGKDELVVLTVGTSEDYIFGIRKAINQLF